MGVNRLRAALTAAALVTAIAAGCSSSTQPGNSPPDGGGTSSSGGSSGSSTSSGSGSSSGSPGDGSIFGSSSSSGSTEAGGASDAMLASDAKPVVDAMVCVAGDAGAPPFPQRCVTMTANECDGVTDQALTGLGVVASLLNGTSGNGFDDDCDGQVDEGCACPNVGLTKPCYEVPASQVDPGTSKPVGWCTVNSLGSLDCVGLEFPVWSGVCRGAQPPYPDDVCAPGDFNCDGLAENSHTTDCSCADATSPTGVECPSTPMSESPYPDPTNIPLIDGSQWIVDPNQRASATNWTWTVVGGDCDNILPHPTFAIYDQPNSMGLQARKGTRTPVQFSATASPPRYVATAGQPLIAIQATAYGDGVAGGQVYPAFGLSGDYLVQGEWDMNGAHYVCTQKVKVTAPGIRAELCWDTVGGEEPTNPAGNDLDLHLARLQGLTCPKKGWDITCQDQQSGNILGDCYWNGITGCRDFSASPPGWGYADSPQASCTGWSSKRKPVDGVNFKQSCTNPRLDRDLVSCDKTIDDPTINTGVAGAAHVFCGPENVNLDNPNDGDKFLIGVNHFNNYLGPSGAHPHVNLYCNGERALSVGYDPVAGQTSFPLLKVPGQDTTGDIWTVGLIITHVSGGQVTSCSVITVPSHHADQARDGVTNPTTSGNEFCVDSTMSNANPPFNYMSHAFVENLLLQPPPKGSIPMTTAGYCKH